MDEPFPMLATRSFEWTGEPGGILSAKAFAASLMRSLFSGTITIFRNREMPLFKVERRQLEEVFLPLRIAEEGAAATRRAQMEYLHAVFAHLRPAPRQWVILAHPASIALRNIDHLFPPDGEGPYRPPETDLVWVPAGNAGRMSGPPEITPGFVAVRGEALPKLLARCEAALRATPHDPAAEARAWSEAVQGLDLRKRPFEAGEVIAPAIAAVDWREVASSALVTVPDWPAEERLRFIQALYFGTYLGDDSGMMLNVLEA